MITSDQVNKARQAFELLSSGYDAQHAPLDPLSVRCELEDFEQRLACLEVFQARLKAVLLELAPDTCKKYLIEPELPY